MCTIKELIIITVFSDCVPSSFFDDIHEPTLTIIIRNNEIDELAERRQNPASDSRREPPSVKRLKTR